MFYAILIYNFALIKELVCWWLPQGRRVEQEAREKCGDVLKVKKKMKSSK